uniref:GNAT family N-acetyltransferase n=1 Tax=uncultured Draconibacterium sp. TaxID=1573823 RepID=UPI0032169E4C
MQFTTLENSTISELTDLFNKSFADYFVKIELTPELLQEKINSEDVQLDKSVGIYFNNEPVGFILHAVRDTIAYNAGTGVIPSFRGKNATSKMYDFILPELKKAGISEIVLEVMEQNTPAIKSYRKAGFNKIANLECFKGKPDTSVKNNYVEIKEVKHINFAELKEFWDWNPTWQHSVETVQKASSYKVFSAVLEGKFCGYMVANPDSGRVAQFAVNRHKRKQGIGTSLFHHLATLYDKEISVINVDGEQPETISFLKNLGLNPFLTQHKMKLFLTR